MTTARRKHTAVAPGLETARPDAGDHSPGESHLPPPNVGEPHRAPAPHNNLSLPRSPLIGRDHEVATVQQLLLQEQVGLLTLTGPGGIGKTRLALQVAANLLDHFVDGVYFVSLAPISDPKLVGAAIAQTLGLREAAGHSLAETLQAYLKDRQLLLVLDNFEQVVAAAALVGDLLNTCRHLKTLVTSRTTLHLYGEQEFPVPPLALPILDFRFGILDSDASTTDQSKIKNPKSKIDAASLSGYAAIDLFCQRASAAKPDFALTASNVADVAKICLRLDGLPLAIELAAARIKLFSPSALLTHLQQRLPLLTGGPHDQPARQRTLRDDIAWSYDLLAPAEQTLFRRLAVFVGGFTLEAAQAVGDTEDDLGFAVLDGVAALVDYNLLKRLETSNGEPRFGMLETILGYGLEQLAASGELETLRRCHAEYYLSLAEEGNRKRQRGEQEVWLPRIECEQSNWRTALAWSRSAGNVEQELRLAGALWYFWLYYGYLNEGRHYLDELLLRSGGLGSQQARANVFEGAGALAYVQGDYQTARSRLEESLALARAFGDKRLIANVLVHLGWVTIFQGDDALAAVQLEESLTIARELDDKFSIAIGLYALGDLTSERGEYEQACCFFEQSRAIWQELGAKWDVAMSFFAQGVAVRRKGDLIQAWSLFKASLALWQELGSSRAFAIADCLDELARLYVIDKKVAHAARLFGAVETLHELIGTPLPIDDIAAMHIQMGVEAFPQAWAEGRAMLPEQAIDYALALPDIPASAPAPVLPPPVAYSADLTAREVEVLRLLAQGLTYAQIADKLIITRRTVNGHVTSIYSKLGVNGRAAATRLAVEHRLV